MCVCEISLLYSATIIRVGHHPFVASYNVFLLTKTFPRIRLLAFLQRSLFTYWNTGFLLVCNAVILVYIAKNEKTQSYAYKPRKHVLHQYKVKKKHTSPPTYDQKHIYILITNVFTFQTRKNPKEVHQFKDTSTHGPRHSSSG
jgi:hypothetical protein